MTAAGVASTVKVYWAVPRVESPMKRSAQNVRCFMNRGMVEWLFGQQVRRPRPPLADHLSRRNQHFGLEKRHFCKTLLLSTDMDKFSYRNAMRLDSRP